VEYANELPWADFICRQMCSCLCPEGARIALELAGMTANEFGV